MIRAIIPCLFLISCSSGDDSTHDVTEVRVHSGYEPAVIGNDIYIPTGGLDDESLCDDGNALRMWALVDDKNNTLVQNGNQIKTIYLKLSVWIGTKDEVEVICSEMTGYEEALGCASFGDGYCRIYVSTEVTCIIWGHELRHCYHGKYHG